MPQTLGPGGPALGLSAPGGLFTACHRPAGRNTTGLPTPAREGFPHGRWAPATPPTTLRATRRGQAAGAFQSEPSGIGVGSPGREAGTLLWEKESGQGRGDAPGAGPGDTGERRGSPPAQPAQARTTHCGPSVRLPQLGGAWVLGAPTKPRADAASPSPLPRPAGSLCGAHPRGAQDRSRQGHQGNTGRASEGAGQPHARVTRVTRHTPGGRRGPR